MASARENIKLKSTAPESHHYYFTIKNRKTSTERLEMKKFDPTPGIRKHVLYKEVK